MITSFAQNFEDVMLWRALGHVENGLYVDIGAQDPVVDSVSKAFYDHGWRGIHVEPTPHYADLLREQRSDETVMQAAVSNVGGILNLFEIPETGLSTANPEIAAQHRENGFNVRQIAVPGITLGEVFSLCEGREIHWLKIDVEGFEGRVLEGWPPMGPRPWIVLVESTLPLTQIESYAEWEPLLLERGYRFAYFDGLNRFYVSDAHSELMAALRTGPNVFDGFAISGTASSSFANVLSLQISLGHAELEACQREHEATLLTNLDREGDLEARIVECEAEKVALIERLAAREQELGDQLHESQQETLHLSQAVAARERQSTRLLLESKEEFVRLSQSLIARQEELSRELRLSQSESLESSRLLVSRSEELTNQLESIRRDTLTLSQTIAARESALVSQVADAELEVARSLQTLAIREDELKRQIGEMRDGLSSEFHGLQSREAGLLRQIEDLSVAYRDAQLRVAQIEASTSWKLTAPIRAVVHKAKRNAVLLPTKENVAALSGDRDANRVGPKALRLISSLKLGLKRYGARGLLTRASRAFRYGGIREIRKRAYIVGTIAANPYSSMNPAVTAGPVDVPTALPEAQSADPARARRLLLDENWSIDEPTWLAYLGEIIESRLVGPLRAAGTPPPSNSLCIVVDCSDGCGAELDRRRTDGALQELIRASEYPISVIWRIDSDRDRDVVGNELGGGKRPSAEILKGEGLVRRLTDDDRVLWLKPGDEVRPEMHMALKYFGCFNSAISIVDLYFRDGGRIFPLLFHAVDYIYGASVDYFQGRFVVSGRFAKSVLEESSAAKPYEIASSALRAIGQRGIHSGVHVPVPLICINIGRANLRKQQTKAIESVASDPMPGPPTSDSCAEAPTVSHQSHRNVGVVICTKDNGLLLRQLVGQLLREPSIGSIVVVSNNSTDPKALTTLRSISCAERVCVLRYDSAFNFSRQCNLGASQLNEDYFLFLNDDISVVGWNWVERLRRWIEQCPDRMVGPLLVYPNERVQHVGMSLGFNGVAGHVLRFSKVPHDDPGLFLSAPRNVSCLTGAALMTSKRLFRALNGFDPNLGTYLQDVDISLRAIRSGAELIVDPTAVLMHMESVSIRPDLERPEIGTRRELEFQYFSKRWGQAVYNDHWMHPLIDVNDESMRTLRV